MDAKWPLLAIDEQLPVHPRCQPRRDRFFTLLGIIACLFWLTCASWTVILWATPAPHVRSTLPPQAEKSVTLNPTFSNLAARHHHHNKEQAIHTSDAHPHPQGHSQPRGTSPFSLPAVPGSFGGHSLVVVVPLLLSAIAMSCCWPGQPSYIMAAATGTSNGNRKFSNNSRSRYNRQQTEQPAYDSSKLAQENRHPRDMLVEKKKSGDFINVQYKDISGAWRKNSGGVRKYINSLFPKFDKDATITRMMEGPDWPREKYINKETGEVMTRREIKNMWDENGKDTMERGNYMHQNIEKDLNGIPPDEALPELQLFRKFNLEILQQRNIKPVRTEMPVFDEDLDLTGVLDFLGQDPTGAFHICEWKRIEDFDSKCSVFANDPSAFWPLEHLPNNDVMKHTLQLNLYARILENKYGLRIAGLWMIVIHPDAPSLIAAQAPFLDKEMDCLWGLRRLSVVASFKNGVPTKDEHDLALEMMKDQDHPMVQYFTSALDTMKAHYADFYGTTDEKVKFEFLRKKAQNLLRIHLIENDLRPKEEVLPDNFPSIIDDLNISEAEFESSDSPQPLEQDVEGPIADL